MRVGPPVDRLTAERPGPVRLEGRHVAIVPLAEEHAQPLWEATRGNDNDHLWAYLSDGPYADRAVFEAAIASKSASSDPLFYGIIDRATGRAVGHAAYLRIEPAHRSIEVGHILYTPDFQRTTGATEAMYLMARHAFEDLGYRRYEWKCNALNQPSRRAALRYGFTFEAIFRQHMIIKGRNRDTAWFSMLDNEWPSCKVAFERWLHPDNFDEGGRQGSSLAAFRASGAATRRYRVVDVFTTEPLEGNPLAVFPDGSGLDGDTMQRIARELNLSETVFVLPATRPDCVTRLRIFTPAREMVFAGHPTVGTCFVLLDEGVVPSDIERFAVEEGIGPVPIRIESGGRPRIWLKTPPIAEGRIFDRATCALWLGLELNDLLDFEPQVLSAGNPTLFVPVKDKDAVDRAGMDMSGMIMLKGSHADSFCVFVFAPVPGGAYSRMFAPEFGIIEDPATGSSTGPLAAYMIRHGLISGAPGTQFVSEQGTKMGRRSLLHVRIDEDGIEVGGYVTPLAEATMQI